MYIAKARVKLFFFSNLFSFLSLIYNSVRIKRQKSHLHKENCVSIQMGDGGEKGSESCKPQKPFFEDSFVEWKFFCFHAAYYRFFSPTLIVEKIVLP